MISFWDGKLCVWEKERKKEAQVGIESEADVNITLKGTWCTLSAVAAALMLSA